jgi:SAM-dependent methyltransferase
MTDDPTHGGDHAAHHGRHHIGAESAADWDARYAAADLVWGGEPNGYVTQYVGAMPPGRAVDLACGQGRNAIYLAGIGWQVTGVDYSAVAVDRARRLAPDITWICADIVGYRPEPVDLALLIYAHLPAADRGTVLRHAAAALRPGGRLLVVGHHRRNIAEGTGGPQNPDILYGPADIVDDLGRVAPDLRIEVAAEPLREVAGADRPAIDTVVLARRP